MTFFYHKAILLFVFVSMTAQAATLVNLKVNFEDNSWREVIHKAYGRRKCVVENREDGGKCLKIPSSLMLKTQKFKYFRGKVKVSFDAKTTQIIPKGASWKVAWCSIYMVTRQGKSYGHRDVMCMSKPSGWKKYSLTLNGLRSDAGSFFVTLGNVGKSGTLWIDNLSIQIEAEGKQLCGDPGFTGAFAVDHWYCPKEGVDWDKLKLTVSRGKAEYQAGGFPDGGKSLHLKNTATFQSARYPYNGESLIFGGWIKQRNVTIGVRSWAKCGFQLVIYNEQGKVLGHLDLSTLRHGTWGWEYFSYFIPAGKFRRDAAYLEIWPRIFEGATGDVWFDQIQLIKLPIDAKFSRKYDTTKAVVSIDAAKPAAKTIRPVWNSTDMSYFMRLNEKVVRKALAMMRKNGVSVLRCREFLQGGKILKKIDSSGNPVYNWKYLDRTLDWAVKEQKFVLTPTLESTPQQIAEKPSKKAYMNRNAPKDAKLWGRIVEDTVNHWIERYGLEVVKKWSFECWNEPRASYYFWGTARQFVKIFNAYVDAMQRIEKKYNTRLIIATFSGISNSSFYKMIFDDLQKSGKLAAVNMISMHSYGGYVNSFSCLERNIRSIQKLVASYPAIKNSPLILTEVNGSTMPTPLNDSSIAAAWNVKTNLVYLNTGVKAGYFFAAIDYLYNRNNKKKYFCGYLGAFTKAGVPKPVFNSIVLLNKLSGAKRIPLSSSNEPVDGIAIMTKKSVKILLTSFDETKLNKSLHTKVKVVVNWPGITKKVKNIMYRVDKNHANSYTAWRQMGKPEINPEASAKLEKANQLVPEEVKSFKIKNGKLLFTLDMPVNSVIYLEFNK